MFEKTIVSEKELANVSGGLSMTKKIMLGASALAVGADAIQGFVRADGDSKLKKLKNTPDKSFIIQGSKGAWGGIKQAWNNKIN